jgi:hypothetical protein
MGMFGKLLDTLEAGLAFSQKAAFIKACRAQNRIRNRLAHHLLDGITLAELRKLARQYEAGERAVIDAFNDADEHFAWFYTVATQDDRWERLIRARIKHAETLADVARGEELLV